MAQGRDVMQLRKNGRLGLIGSLYFFHFSLLTKRSKKSCRESVTMKLCTSRPDDTHSHTTDDTQRGKEKILTLELSNAWLQRNMERGSKIHFFVGYPCYVHLFSYPVRILLFWISYSGYVLQSWKVKW